MNNNKENRGLWEALKARGYAVALVLCAAAIGIGGIVYYQTSKPEHKESLGTTVTTPGTTLPQASRPVSNLPENVVPAIGTNPTTPATSLPQASEPEAGTKPSRTTRPVEGQTAAAYSMDRLAYNETTRDWRVHNGIDLAAEEGTKVVAAAAGTVVSVTTDDVMGTTVVLRHSGGFTTTYASLAPETEVAEGDTVSCGEVLGYVGSSALTETALAPHVHFAVTLNGLEMNPEEFWN